MGRSRIQKSLVFGLITESNKTRTSDTTAFSVEVSSIDLGGIFIHIHVYYDLQLQRYCITPENWLIPLLITDCFCNQCRHNTTTLTVTLAFYKLEKFGCFFFWGVFIFVFIWGGVLILLGRKFWTTVRLKP
jgi:hypothetical protein